MGRKRRSPDDPREWLNRARSNLALARKMAPAIYLEDLCFDAQQAAEKGIKAECSEDKRNCSARAVLAIGASWRCSKKRSPGR